MKRLNKDLYHHCEKRIRIDARFMPEAVEYAKRITGTTGPSQAVRLLVEKAYFDDLKSKVDMAEAKRRMEQ